MSDINASMDNAIDRRSVVKAGLALGGVLCASLLSGCSLLGIENPNDVEYDDVDDPGLVDFENVEIRLSVDSSYWTWLVYEDAASADNGNLVVGVPAIAVNGDDSARVISDMYCKVISPAGVQLASLADVYADDLRNTGSMSVGQSSTGTIYFMFQGSGTYTVQFDNMLGRKPSVSFDVNFSDAPQGAAPLPANINAANAEQSVVQGTSFAVGDATFTFGTDTSAYVWDTVSREGDEYWNGRAVVGIPMRATNTSASVWHISQMRYQIYSPYTNQVSDASSLYANSVTSVFENLSPNQTSQAYLYFAYDTNEATHYVRFCNEGLPVMASVWVP